MAATQLGTVPLTVNSLHIWQRTLTKDGAVWDLSAETVYFWWRDQYGTATKQLATGDSAGLCAYTDTATQIPRAGTWTFSVEVVGFGLVVSVPFSVEPSP